jgi:hypothetical protein
LSSITRICKCSCVAAGRRFIVYHDLVPVLMTLDRERPHAILRMFYSVIGPIGSLERGRAIGVLYRPTGDSLPGLVASDKEEIMRIHFLAALAGAVFAIAIALPNRVDAMTFLTPSGVLDAAATIEVAPPELVRSCGRRGCWGHYRYYNYYRSWPHYYPSMAPPWGWDWPRCLQTALLPC